VSEAENQLRSFIAKFDPDTQALINGIRAVLRKRLPTCNEMVYDNYNFFVIGYVPSIRPSDCIVSIAAAANGVSLSFFRGSELDDPDEVLQGESKVNRFIRLPSSDVLLRPEVDAMIERACKLSNVAQPWTGGELIIRSISAKQRPRRK
jgi:hypothetical protein